MEYKKLYYDGKGNQGRLKHGSLEWWSAVVFIETIRRLRIEMNVPYPRSVPILQRDLDKTVNGLNLLKKLLLHFNYFNLTFEKLAEVMGPEIIIGCDAEGPGNKKGGEEEMAKRSKGRNKKKKKAKIESTVKKTTSQ